MKFSIFSKSLVFTFLMLTGYSQLAHSQDYKSSVGGRLGTYVAVSFTSYISENRSLEGIAGITREANQSDFIIGGFYKLHQSLTSQVPTIKWYFGVGLYVNFQEELGVNRVAFAPSAILGSEYTLEHTPINFFLDLSPNYDTGTITDSKFSIHANLGVRYVLSSYD